MTNRIVENRSFYVAWLFAVLCAIAATGLRRMLGEGVLFIPLVGGASLGIAVALILQIGRRRLVESARSRINDLEMLQLQLKKEHLQTYLTVVTSGASGTSNINAERSKLVGIDQQPRVPALVPVSC
jgi:hypothetical protein